jgi:hypothetical protein
VGRQALIESRAALSYQEAQMRIDDPSANDEVTAGLRRLLAVARVLRHRRTEAGALQLASPEVKFKLEAETLDPLDVGMYQVGRGLPRLSSYSVPLAAASRMLCPKSKLRQCTEKLVWDST